MLTQQILLKLSEVLRDFTPRDRGIALEQARSIYSMDPTVSTPEEVFDWQVRLVKIFFGNEVALEVSELRRLLPHIAVADSNGSLMPFTIVLKQRVTLREMVASIILDGIHGEWWRKNEPEITDLANTPHGHYLAVDIRQSMNGNGSGERLDCTISEGAMTATFCPAILKRFQAFTIPASVHKARHECDDGRILGIMNHQGAPRVALFDQEEVKTIPHLTCLKRLGLD